MSGPLAVALIAIAGTGLTAGCHGSSDDDTGSADGGVKKTSSSITGDAGDDGDASSVTTTTGDGGGVTVVTPDASTSDDASTTAPDATSGVVTWAQLPTTSSGCGMAATPTASSDGDMETVMVGGTARQYVLFVPQGYNPAQAYPVVTLFHGIGATGEDMAQYIQMQVYSGNNAIVAFPTAVNGNWDLSGTTDLQFYDAIMADLESRLCINQQRQFALGFSLGAYMVNHLGCNRPTIRSFVAADGGFDDAASSCTPGTSPFIYHRRADNNEAVANGEAARDKWLGIYGCNQTQTPLESFGFSGPEGDPTAASGCVTYGGCSVTPNVTWCEDTYDSWPYPHDLRDVYRTPMWNFFNSL